MLMLAKSAPRRLASQARAVVLRGASLRSLAYLRITPRSSGDGKTNRVQGDCDAGELGYFLYGGEQHRFIVGTGQAPVLDLETEELEGEALELLHGNCSVPFSLKLLAADEQCSRISVEVVSGHDLANAVADPPACRGAWDLELGKEIGITSLSSGPFEPMVVCPMPRHGALYVRLLSIEDSTAWASNLPAGSTSL
jgi:hypothetical protein